MPNLGVPLIGQETDMWCWAASAEMIMAFHRQPVPQCEQANHAFGQTNACAQPTPAACVRGGWPDFGHWKFTSVAGRDGQALSFSAIQAQIDAERPFAFSWRWTGSDKGHMMIVIGYAVASGNSFVQVNDPWPVGVGDTTAYTYDNFVAGDVWQRTRSPHTHWRDYWDIVPVAAAPAGGAPGAGGRSGQLPVVQDVDGDIADAARRGIEVLDERGSAGDADGLTQPGGAPSLEWAEPELRVNYIFEDRLLDLGGRGDLSELLVDGGEVIIPLSTDGVVTSSVVVVEGDAGWAIAAVGRPNLTAAITRARSRHASDTGRDPADYFVVHVPHMYRVYLGFEGATGTEITPVIMSGPEARLEELDLVAAPGAGLDPSLLVQELAESARTFPAALPDTPLIA